VVGVHAGGGVGVYGQSATGAGVVGSTTGNGGVAVRAIVGGAGSTAVRADGNCNNCVGLDITGNIKVSGSYKPAFQTIALVNPSASLSLSYFGAAATDILYVTPVNNSAPTTFPSFILSWTGSDWKIWNTSNDGSPALFAAGTIFNILVIKQ